MSAAALLKRAGAAGIALRVQNGMLFGCGLEQAPGLRAELAAHRRELIALLAPMPPATSATVCFRCGAEGATVEFGDSTAFAAQTMCRACSREAFRQIGAGSPEPDVNAFAAAVASNFRTDTANAPAPYRRAWEALRDRCPAGVTELQRVRALGDLPTLFEDWSRELRRFYYRPCDIYAVPDGLIWFLEGSPVVAIGEAMAQCADGRIWKRPGPAAPAAPAAFVNHKQKSGRRGFISTPAHHQSDPALAARWAAIKKKLRPAPPPDMQELIVKYGGYNKITKEAWADYDARMVAYRDRLRGGCDA